MMTDLTKYKYETFDFGDAVNLSQDSSSSLQTAQKEAEKAKELADKIAAEAPPPPTFSEAELEAVKKAAFAEGKAAGEKEQAEKNQQEKAVEELRANDLLKKIDAQIAMHAKDSAAAQKKTAEKLKGIALAAAKKIVTGMPDSAVKQIEAFIDGALGVVSDEQQVKLALHPQTAKEFVEKMSERFEHMEIVEDDSILPNDLKIMWDNGYAERKLDELWKEIGQIIVGDFNIDEFATQEKPAEQVVEEVKQEEITNITGEENVG